MGIYNKANSFIANEQRLFLLQTFGNYTYLMRNFHDQDWQNVTTANFKDLFLGLKMPLTLNSRENKASQ